MVSPAITIVIDWLCLLTTYLVCGLRLIIICTRTRKKIRSHYDTEIFLCLTLATATAAVISNTVKNARLMRDGSGGSGVALQSTSAESVQDEDAEILRLKVAPRSIALGACVC
jgi:hypothetical protein